MSSLWSVREYDEVGSTQDLALAAARAGEAGPLAIIAARQVAGRGRGGREWTAPEGNLNFSALLRPPRGETVIAGGWALLAGVAVFGAVASFVPRTRLMLKWPNDLLLDGGKVAGVLIDSALGADGLFDWVVMGVGINLAVAPPVTGRVTACVADAGVVVTPGAVAARLMGEIDIWRAAGFGAVRAAWLERAHPVGTRLCVRRGADMVEGAFAGLTEDGRLRLDGAGDTASGEVEVI
jgi:BirA family biotin operon repressor/biotin-[acetyl-CoA-carboxylase] ligase